MSGSGGDTGYDYQADAIAFVAAHALTEQPLPWFTPETDIPESWSAETGGPGDDISIKTTAGSTIEVQAKHGLTRGSDYEEAFKRLVKGLRRDSHLRAVMLVDRHASQIIRDDLKTDITRLGQGRDDGLKTITTELLALLGENSKEQSLFARLRIAVIDLDDGNDGAAAAQALLSKVVAPDKCRAAFTLLGKRGHQLIKQRGSDDSMQCARYLSAEVGILPNSDAPSLSRLRFIDWSLSVSGDFYSPALQARYPISKAWSTLLPLETAAVDAERISPSPLEAELARYQEWTRLATSRKRYDELSAESLIARHRWTVIVGGPGSGKTTLGKKLVWQTSRHNLVIRARLPSISALLSLGKNFNDALAEVGSDAFGGSDAERLSLLRNCYLVVLDALDECDPFRAEVAGQISRWAAAHPHIRVCVLSRPVGHAHASLPGFIHAELLPLNEANVREAVDTLLVPRYPVQTIRDIEATKFVNLVHSGENRSVASIAAHNPLLLSFLVRLFLDGESLDGNRAALFERVVELIRKSPPSEKLQGSHLSPSSAIAWISAETIGWGTIEEPQRSAAKLCELVAGQFGKTYDELDTAERVIDFWSRQGLVERVTVGSRDAVVFVHLSIGEFLAGRYLARQSERSIQNQIELKRRQPHWREPILLASGCGATKAIVSALLKFDSPTDPESTEAMLAAAALAENVVDGEISQEARAVCHNLEMRLISDVPLLSVESAMALIRLAPIVPDLLTELSLHLRNHEHAWTRLAAFCLGLLGHANKLPLDEVISWLSTVRGSSDLRFGDETNQWGVDIYELTKAAIPKALKRVAEELPAEDAESFVLEFLSRADISVGVLTEVQKELDVDPYRMWVLKGTALLEQAGLFREIMQRMQASHAITHAVESSMMAILLDLLEDQPRGDLQSPTETTFPNLGRLISSMKLGDMAAGDLTLIGASAFPIVKEVFRGMLYGLPLDLPELRIEAQRMALELEKSDTSLLMVGKDIRDLNSDRIAEAPLNMPLLMEGLVHPSDLIGFNALQILNVSDLSGPVRDILTKTFMKSTGRALKRCSFLIAKRFSTDAFDLFISRWGTGPVEACGVLFQFLFDASQNDKHKEKAIQIALEGIESSSPQLAEAAAISLAPVDAEFLREYADRFATLFEEWKTRGSWCSHCKKAVYQYSCPDCSIVPPSPRKHLVPVLTKARYFSFDDLARLIEDTDDGVAGAATASVIRWALTNDVIANRTFELIFAGSLRLLDEFIDQTGPELAHMGLRLRPLLSSPSPTIRARVLGTIASRWMNEEASRAALLAATKDSSPKVRSAAAKVLRSGSSDESELFS